MNRGSARFNTFFTPGLGGDPKFADVVNPANTYTPNGALARAVAASLLNVRAGYVPPLILTEALVKKIWTDCNGAGFQPTAGVTWGPAEAAAWLATTWT